MANTHIIPESIDRNRLAVPCPHEDAQDLRAIHAEITKVTEAYKADMNRLIAAAALFTSHVDQKDEQQTVSDYLEDMAGDTFANWPGIAGRFVREAS